MFWLFSMYYQSFIGQETGYRCFNPCTVINIEIIPRSSFYERLSIMFLLMLITIAIRFYDFLEASIFRSMTQQQKLRFLLYLLSTVEAMFDYSLLALNLEILLELSLVLYQEVKLWIIYLGLAGGIPITFLFLYIIVWETSSV